MSNGPLGMIAAFTEAANASIENILMRITGVHYGPIVDGVDCIRFRIDSRLLQGKLCGRNRDFVLSLDNTANKHLAIRTLVDGDCTIVTPTQTL